MSKSSTTLIRLKRLTAMALTAAAVTSATMSPAHAIVDASMGTWTTTLQGRDLDSDFSNGFEAYYDTDLDITWLADANIVGEGFKFLQAQPFLDEHTIYGIEGWQLPYLQPTSDVVDTTDKSVQSSLAHLFWVTLGNTPFTGESCGGHGPACAGGGTSTVHAAPVNTGPFSNLSIDSDFWFNRADTTRSQVG